MPFGENAMHPRHVVKKSRHACVIHVSDNDKCMFCRGGCYASTGAMGCRVSGWFVSLQISGALKHMSYASSMSRNVLCQHVMYLCLLDLMQYLSLGPACDSFWAHVAPRNR